MPRVEPPADAPNTVDVELTSTNRDGHFHVWTDTGLLPICWAPCATSLPKGIPLHLALSEGSGSAKTAAPIVLQGPSRIQGTYVSRLGLRTAGILTFFGSIIAGVAIGFIGSGKETCDASGCSRTVSTGAGIAAFSVAFAGGITGIVLAFQPDKFDIRIAPLSTADLTPHGDRGPWRGTRETAPSGLGLRLRF